MWHLFATCDPLSSWLPVGDGEKARHRSVGADGARHALLTGPSPYERCLAVDGYRRLSLADGRPCRDGQPFAELSYATRAIAVVLGQAAALEARRHGGPYDMG